MPYSRNSDSAALFAELLNRSLFPARSLATDTQAECGNQASAGGSLSPFRHRSTASGRLLLLRIAICAAVVFVASSATAWPSPSARPVLRARAACPPAAHPFAAFVTEAARRFSSPESWIRAVMRVESFGNERAVSPKGAIGLMQVMPNTYAELRVRHRLGADPCDAHDNILAGAAYLREMLDRYGSPGFLAAYNAGPARYDEHLLKGRPLPMETQDYVAKLAPMIGMQPGDDRKAPGFDLVAWLHAALFPTRADPPSGAIPLAAKPPSDRSPAVRRVVDLSALAPSSEGLFVRLASKDGQQ